MMVRVGFRIQLDRLGTSLGTRGPILIAAHDHLPLNFRSRISRALHTVCQNLYHAPNLLLLQLYFRIWKRSRSNRTRG
eukprot:122719-Rhodomonas_salina.2